VRESPLTPERPEIPHLRGITLTLLGVLLALIGWLAMVAEPPSRSGSGAVPAGQAGVTEQRLQLQDGRRVLCLIFPGTIAASCEWGAAR